MAKAPARVTPGSPREHRHLTQRQFDRIATFVLLGLNGWHLARLRATYLEFDGDIVAAMVLGEVTHHNLSTIAPALDYSPERILRHLAAPDGIADLLPCNSYSIAESTGIPRETVRRKVAKLIRQGLLTRRGRNDLYLSHHPGAYARFEAFTLESANDLLALAEAIRQRAGVGV